MLNVRKVNMKYCNARLTAYSLKTPNTIPLNIGIVAILLFYNIVSKYNLPA